MKTQKIIVLVVTILNCLLPISTAYCFQNEAIRENNLITNRQKQDSLDIQIAAKMKKHNLQGLSVAVLENYKIVWTKDYGFKASGSNDKIDRNTAYSTASISKPVTAILCGILEEKGLINLNDPIANYLKSWHLPKSEFTNDIELTWVHLLSHTAGINQGGFPDYYEGDKIPTILQSLKGELSSRTDGPVEFLFKPGTNWQYSGGGYVIVQLALEDYFGKPLAVLADEYLFKPLQLNNTTMKQPNENGFLSNLAKVHDRAGNIIKTGLPITPQVAPSGMWSTSADLAKIVLEMQNALRGKDNKVISTAVAKRLTTLITYQNISGYGIGWQRSLGFGNQDWFSHMGSNTGVGGEIMGTMEGGNGIVMLANGDIPNRLPVLNYMREQVFKLYQWNLPIDPSLIKKLPANLSKKVSGSYLDFLYGDRGINQIFESEGKLYINTPLFRLLLNDNKTEMFYMGNDTFKIANYPNYLTFNFNKQDSLTGIDIYRYPSDQHRLMIPLNKIRNLKTELIDLFTKETFTIAKSKYQKLKNQYKTYDFQGTINTIAALFYYEDKIDRCLQLLEFNRGENPDSWDVYDSLGEIYEVIQKYDDAIKNYQKAMELSDSKAYKEQIKTKIDNLITANKNHQTGS